MIFQTPWFLSALTLASIPLLIHLLRRRKVVVVQWAAMEFLKNSLKRERKRLRVEELLLLALRMLIVLLAAFAFARPVLRAVGLPILSRGSRVHAVIVLDNSMSMGFRELDGKTDFERAKASADQLFSHVLQPGDSASLILLSDHPVALVASPSFDLELVRQRLKSAKLSSNGTDNLAAAQMVNTLLKASKTPEKEVYWFSDSQQSAWENGKLGNAKPIWSELGRLARLTWVSVQEPGVRENVAVEQPVLGRELVTSQIPTRIESIIRNHGGKRKADVTMHLLLDGKPAGTTRINLPANGSETARFVTLFTQPGLHSGKIEFDSPEQVDALLADNSQPFVVQVREKIKVLVLDSTIDSDIEHSEAFYLMTAMAPGEGAQSIATTRHAASGLSKLSLSDFEVIVAAGVSKTSPDDIQSLKQYVQEGGGLLLFPSAATNSELVNSELEPAGLLPARLRNKRTLPEDQSITLDPASIDHPALNLFKDATQSDLSSARFNITTPLLPIVVAEDPNAVHTMIKFSNGEPALVERKVEIGKVIIAASSASTAWNQLPLKPGFVSLVHQLISYLGQGASARHNLLPGEMVSLHLPITAARKPVHITYPDGTSAQQNSVLESGGVTLPFTAGTQVGITKIQEPVSHFEDLIAVGRNSNESDLASSDPGPELTALGVPAAHLTVAKDTANLLDSVHRSRFGSEIWRPLIWLLIPLLLLESLLAQRFGRRG